MTNIEELDRRLRVLEDRLSPAETVAVEPEWAAGTAGTATVRGVPDVRVMRLDWVLQHGEVGERATWAAAVQIPDGGQLLGLHFDDQVTDFVPDPAPGVIPDDVANAIAANWQARLDAVVCERNKVAFSLDHAQKALKVARRELDLANDVVRQTKELMERRTTTLGTRAERAERERDEARAEVERLRDQLAAVETYGPRPDAAPEPRPAFVLPEREAVEALLDRHRLSTNPINLGQYQTEYTCDCGVKWVRDGHANDPQPTLATHHADAVLALLAEHAVTEERLRDALESALLLDQRTPLDERVEETREVLGHLTGKAEG